MIRKSNRAPSERVQLPDFAERTALASAVKRKGRHAGLDQARADRVLCETTSLVQILGMKAFPQRGNRSRADSRNGKRTHDADSGAAEDLRARVGEVDHTGLGGAVSNCMNKILAAKTDALPLGDCTRRAGPESPLQSKRHRTCNLADRHRISDPPLIRTQVSRQRRGAEPALVRESGREGVRTGSGQDDGTAGDLGRVLLHDGRGVLDGEEAAV